ncbi:MAG TPA: dienelactone hydrolase family protein [Acidimicrobiales bacterium]|jgi:carboxymethylenebutenolidase
MPEEMLSIPAPDGAMGAYVRRPEGDGPFPVIVYFHHGPGLDAGSKESMQRLADAGYYVVSPDRYHREGAWLTFDPAIMRSGTPEGDALRTRMFSILMETTDDLVESDLKALLTSLDTQSAARAAPMGAIGFCIGARSVLRTIANHPDVFTAGVALHPSFCTTADADSPHLGVPSYSGYLYVGFGAEDKMQSAADNDDFINATNAMSDGRGLAEIHDGADHGFAVPGGAYHDAAADRSYQKALEIFDQAVA